MDDPIGTKTVQLERLKFILEKRIAAELVDLIDADSIEVRYSLFDSLADDVAIHVRDIVTYRDKPAA
jgi:hypothetical protein